MKAREGNILLVILLLIASGALVLAGYFFYQNQQVKKPEAVNTDWKTYTNTKYNFTIDYPQNLLLDENDSQRGASFGDVVTLYVGQKSGGYDDVPLAEYAKVAANKEIQNHNELASYKTVTTKSGLVGYETTWMVQSIIHPDTTKPSEGTPITYFEIPGDKHNLLRISLNRNQDLETYEKMLTTVTFTKIAEPEPPVDEEAVLKNVIKKYIAVKHSSSTDDLTITVSKIDGNFAQGGVTDEGGGGMWFAAKEEGSWQLVWDGNGVIECSIFSLYPDFPTSMISGCWDEKSQNTIQR